MKVKWVQIDFRTWNFLMRIRFCWAVLTKKVAGVRTNDVTIKEDS